MTVIAVALPSTLAIVAAQPEIPLLIAAAHEHQPLIATLVSGLAGVKPRQIVQFLAIGARERANLANPLACSGGLGQLGGLDDLRHRLAPPSPAP